MKRLYNTPEHKEEVKAALQDGRLFVILTALFFPKAAKKFIIRVLCVALGAFLIFKFILLPLVIRGGSMNPTYPERGFIFCFAPAKYLFKPERGDVVIMRYGKGVMLLKRVIGLPGDRIAFRKGVLYLTQQNPAAGNCRNGSFHKVTSIWWGITALYPWKNTYSVK